MSENKKQLNADEIKRLLHLVGEELRISGHRATIYVVGGANIALTVNDARTSFDVDAVFKTGHDEVIEAAARVAAKEEGLGADWLNSQFTGGDDPEGGLTWSWFDNRNADVAGLFFESENLTVELASPEMMLALKTIAARPQDLPDAYALMRVTGQRTYEDLSRNIATFTGQRLFEAQGGLATAIHLREAIREIVNNAPPDLQPARKPGLIERIRHRFSRQADQPVEVAASPEAQIWLDRLKSQEQESMTLLRNGLVSNDSLLEFAQTKRWLLAVEDIELAEAFKMYETELDPQPVGNDMDEISISPEVLGPPVSVPGPHAPDIKAPPDPDEPGPEFLGPH